MKLLFSELHKIWGQRVFALCLAVLVAANLFLLYIGTKPGENSAPAAAYRAVTSDLTGLDTESQQQFINQKLDLVYGVLQVEQVLAQSAGGGEWGIQLRKEYADVLEQYEEIYRNRDYQLYTSDLRTEYYLLSQIKAELDTVAAYPKFLEEVQAKANQLSEISIFQTSANGYNQKNIDKTAQVYAGMGNIKINYSPQKGLFTALDYQFTDLILLAAMLLMASLLVRQERDSGMLEVVRSTPAGRLKTAMAKLAALAASMLVVLLLMYGVNLVYCGLTFGLGPLSRSIQSVPALMRCTMQITVGEYLGRFLLAKWAGAFVMGLWVLLAMLWAQRTFTGWLAALALPVVQWLIRTAIPATSRLNVIKYANLASLMRTNELLGNYRNLYWFDTPVSLPLVEWLSVLVYGGLLLSGFCLLFCRAQLPSAPAFAGFCRKTAKTKSTTVLRQEARKLYLLGGALAILLVFGVYQVWTTVKTESYINAEGIYYAHYMKQLEGPYTKETYVTLQTMQKEFKPIFELQSKMQRGEISPSTYEIQMAAYYGLQEKLNVFQGIVYGNLSYIKENPQAHLVYERGWEKLFGFSGDGDLQDVLWAGVLSCICFGGLFAYEKKGGMQRVLMATPLGRRNTVTHKLMAGSIAATAITLLTYLPHLIVILRDYGLGQFFAPAMSLTQFHWIAAWVPLAGILIWGLVGRFAACFTMMFLLFWLSDCIGNSLASTFVGSLLLCLPPMLSLSGITALRWIGCYPLFHLAELAQRPLDSLAGILCLFIAASVCWLCSQDLYRRWGNADIMKQKENSL